MPSQRQNSGVSIEHVPEGVRAALWRHTDDPYNRRHVVAGLRHVPQRFHSHIVAAYGRTLQARGHFAANTEIIDVAEAFNAGGLSLAASDWEIVAAAKRRAAEVSGVMGDLIICGSDYVRGNLERYAKKYGVKPPGEKTTLAGMVARMTDPQWWRRALRRSIVRAVERQAVRLGLVHRRASIYASAEAVARRAEQKRRNARMLEQTEAENEMGQVFTLADLSSRNVSNPQVRRAELMTRIAGFEDFAKSAGHVGMFYTATCPSRMHARLSVSGEANPKFDGTTPRDAQAYLTDQWAKARAWLHRRGVFVYGFRIAEPHHDATPHWHMLLFMPQDAAQGVTAGLKKYFSEVDGAELSADAARAARFKAIEIDTERGSAAGYIAKYVAKNIDGYKVGMDEEAPQSDAADTVRNVDAWAATWGIRQFQQIGGPGVTIWRELRRVRELGAHPQRELFAAAWGAADAGDWRGYVDAMGGVECMREDRPLQLWRVYADRLNRYYEDAGEVVRGVTHAAAPLLSPLCTRMHEWRIRGSREAEKGLDRLGGDGVHYRERGIGGRGRGGVVLTPWTRVNNCSGQNSADG